MEEENGCDEGEREDEDDKGVSVDNGRIVGINNEGEKVEESTYTRSPGESSV